MSRWRLVILAVAIVALAGVGLAKAQPQSGIVRPTTEPPTPSVQLGAQLYAGNCASCHGIDGSGITSGRRGAGGIVGEGPSLKGVGALSADFYLRRGYMPLNSIHDQPTNERVLLSDKEIRSLTTYVASLGSGPAIPQPQPQQGKVDEGLHLFAEHCAGCHQIAAQGGFVTGARVPPLQTVTPTEIAEAVRVGPYLMPAFSTKQISDAQLNSLIAYVLSTKHPNNRGGWGIGNIGPVPEGIITWFVAIIALVAVCTVLGKRFRA